MQKRKHKYLYQLICTSIILVVLPVLLFYFVVWKQSFNEINRINTEYYNNLLTTFSGTFANEVFQFKQYVTGFSVNSRSNLENGGIFFEGTTKMEENAYWFWEASDGLKSHAQKAGYSDVGVYYYDKDIILMNGSKYTKKRYIEEGVQVTEEKGKAYLGRFFSKEQYEQTNMIFAPVYEADGKYKELLVGVCTILGKDKEQALMFYRITGEDTEFFYVSAQGRSWEKYYVLDGKGEEILYYIGKSEDAVTTKPEWKENQTVKSEGTDWFSMYHERLDLTFLIDVSEDDMQNSVICFYHDMQLFFMYIIISLLCISLAVVYINYKPMHNLLLRMKTKGKNEFDTILNVWEDQKDLLTQQRMMIMDLLMNHMIYGGPISQKYVEKLGVSNRVTNYCVFLIEGQVLRAFDVTAITEEIEKAFRTLLFVTDLTGEKTTIIIAFMEGDKSETIKNWLEAWCGEHISETYKLRTGCVVDRIDEIQKSMASCIEVPGQEDAQTDAGVIMDSQSVSEKVRNRTEYNERLKEEILNYLDDNYMNGDLSQTEVADYFQISVYTLSKMFNNQIGMGFSKYINSKRIETAKNLLITTEHSVKEIANMVGVADDNYFSRIFKKYRGVSPLEFRNENKCCIIQHVKLVRG